MTIGVKDSNGGQRQQKNGAPAPRVTLGRPLFEIPEPDYLRSPFRRSKLRLGWGTLVAGTGLIALALVFVSLGRGSPNLYLAYGIGVVALLGVAFWQLKSVSRLNRFGIFEGGIAPPRRPRGHPRGERVVIPYALLDKMEFKTIGEDLFPKSHYGVTLCLSSGEVLEFDATEIFAQTRWDERRTAHAQMLLDKLAKEFREHWSDSNRARRWFQG